MQSQEYCLKWKFHHANIQTTFSLLRDKAKYCDVTLWCGGTALRAHRAVLASCSELFCQLLSEHDLAVGEPALVLTDSEHAHHLKNLLKFMYTGEVSVHHSELTSLLKTAEELQIKGLADVSWKDSSDSPEGPSGNGTEISLSSNLPSSPNSSKPEDELTKSMPKTQFVKTPNSDLLNGPPIVSDPPKRKRGRPPLEPKSSALENEVIVDAPKRPNILRKSKQPQEPKIDNIETLPNWGRGNQENETDDLLSEYSEASLDGRDISHFLDTTMEIEPGEGMFKVDTTNKKIILIPPDGEGHTSKLKKNVNFPDVVKLSDYLVSGRRTQFWAEDYVKRVMEAVFCRELEMKQAAEILGVSYGTLYGRYRETFGCINRPYRAREFWAENADILAKLQRKEITFIKAAELLNVTPQMLFSYVNSGTEPIINQKEATDVFTDAILRANSKTEPEKLDCSEPEQSNSTDNESKESYNRLSNIFRKRLEDTANETEEPDKETDPKVTTIDDSSASDVSESDQSAPVPVDVEEKNDGVEKKEVESVLTTTSTGSVKKLPLIRVANLKFLKGESSKTNTNVAANINDITDKSSPIILKAINTHIRPDMKMIASQRKVTLEEIEHSLKNTKRIQSATVPKPPVHYVINN